MEKPHGERGSWFASWEGKMLPCVHKHWWTGRNGYSDPYARPDDPKFKELVDSIRQCGRVILTSDTLLDGAHNFKRTGYIAIYDVANIEFDESGLRFEFTARHEFT